MKQPTHCICPDCGALVWLGAKCACGDADQLRGHRGTGPEVPEEAIVATVVDIYAHRIVCPKGWAGGQGECVCAEDVTPLWPAWGHLRVVASGQHIEPCDPGAAGWDANGSEVTP